MRKTCVKTENNFALNRSAIALISIISLVHIFGTKLKPNDAFSLFGTSGPSAAYLTEHRLSISGYLTQYSNNISFLSLQHAVTSYAKNWSSLKSFVYSVSVVSTQTRRTQRGHGKWDGPADPDASS